MATSEDARQRWAGNRQHHRLRRLPRHRLERVQGGKPALHLSRPYADRAMTAIHKPFKEQGRFDQQSQVCGQCHVEYYFSSPTKAVKFPGTRGTTVEQMGSITMK